MKGQRDQNLWMLHVIWDKNPTKNHKQRNKQKQQNMCSLSVFEAMGENISHWLVISHSVTFHANH